MSVSKFPSLLLSRFTKFPTVLNLLASTFVFAFAVAIAAYANPTVTVISPKSGISAGSPVFYEASATSPGCAGGIAAMRIYSAPGVNAFTVNGAHIEQFIDLAPGTYSTVVQAWDNCGGVSKTPVDLTVSSDAGVSVYLPSQSQANWPVHIAASAESPSCANGIASIRIYTAPGVAPYTIDSNQLDAYVNLVPGTYDMAIQSWDNCGNVFKSPLTEVVTAGSDGYLYGVVPRGVGQFEINSNGTLTNPNGSGNPPTFAAQSAGTLAADPGGWFVYASSDEGIYGFQVNQSNAALVPIPGSPFPLNTAVGDSASPTIVMDPAGNFVYLAYRGDGYSEEASLATYRIDRSSGSLTWTGWGYSFGNPAADCYSGLAGLAANFTGQYLYVGAIGCEQPTQTETYGFQTDPNHGFLNTQVPGSPYSFFGSPTSTGDYLYLGAANFDNTNGEVLGTSIDSGTGALTQSSDSPFFAGPPDWPISSVWTDWKGRFLWAWEVQDVEGQDEGLQAFVINPATRDLASSGALQQFPVTIDFSLGLVEDHTGEFVFTSSLPNQGSNQIASWTISSEGTLMPLNTVALPANDGVGSIVAVRKAPN
jgi:hypothetical protein